MKKEEIELMIGANMSIADIAENTGKSKSGIRYWLRFYKLKTNHPNTKLGEKYIKTEDKKCPKCNIEKTKDYFYKRRDGSDFSTYCKDCTRQDTIDRQRKLKQLCVTYKGGECSKCGYNKCIGALDFHHLNPDEKDFSIGHLKNYSFSDKIKKELDKCVLLCSNCHREKHYL